MPAVPSMEEFNERIVPALEAANLPRFEAPLDQATSIVQLVRQHYLNCHDDGSESHCSSVFSRPIVSQFAPYGDHRGEVSRERWLTALESGNHAQIHGALTSPVTNDRRLDPATCQSLSTCCLGVAPKLLDLPFAHDRSWDSIVPSVVTAVTDDAAYLIEGLREHEVSLAMALNDSALYTFQQIATVFRILWNMPRPDQTSIPPIYRTLYD